MLYSIIIIIIIIIISLIIVVVFTVIDQFFIGAAILLLKTVIQILSALISQGLYTCGRFSDSLVVSCWYLSRTFKVGTKQETTSENNNNNNINDNVEREREREREREKEREKEREREHCKSCFQTLCNFLVFFYNNFNTFTTKMTQNKY